MSQKNEMIPKVIKTEEEHTRALARIEELMNAEAGTPECDELELLSVLVERYEDEQYPIDLPDSTSAIKLRIEQRDFHKGDRVIVNDKVRDIYVNLTGPSEIGRTGTVWNCNRISSDVFVKLDYNSQIIARDVRCLDRIFPKGTLEKNLA